MQYQSAPTGALSAADLLKWLDQVADDRDLAPVTSRIATRLAAKLTGSEPRVELVLDAVADDLRIGRSTAHRALAALRERGHVLAAPCRGNVLAYQPVLRQEA
ncbi:hypothetical protein LV780_03800 [Cereibacter azotoformans]|uniref:Uncharacterized protein n=1 Tax=Cereibacter azotoformans TaxID=43057 RepID=A0A2T5JWS3_9RHOB|nr:hypothetical protein [Cereibacter azotoformans]AXQ93010.1 hypothetical protein D0Z66_03790 [Cereibacter sphaeroides]MBO4169300.1 hypothetical protein [Cereibacter azotoformans]PTR14600.1 hypothetical protein C8J28_11672 [Cereibacter azotoformans]UIJ31312.1 hypothetical protein LV780_03800 [Cereibacter azotoformans]